MLPNSLLKLNTLHLNIKSELTVVSTAVHLNSHADGPLMWAVGVKSDLGGEDDRVQVLLDGDVGVGVAVHDLAVLDVAVAHPLIEPGSEVLQEVVLRELRALAVAEPAHGLGGGDGVHGAQVHLQPLRPVLADHVTGAPGPARLVHAHPEMWNCFYLRELDNSLITVSKNKIDFNNGER